jgi:hypothetical protein
MKFWSRAVTAAALALGLTVLAASAAATPTAPRSLKGAAQDEQVTLSWSTPSAGSPIDYQVITSPADYPRTTVPATSLTVTGLKNGTTYSFAVRARNSSGYGPAARTTAVPKATPPGPPTNLGATQTGSGQVRLDWTPPATNGSAPAGGATPNIHHYNVTVNPGATRATVPASTLTYSISGLADNLTYTFTVTATNTRPVTGSAATVYAPLPTGASIGLQPTAGIPTTSITVTGQLFLKNESITLYWDTSTHIAAGIVSDGNGGFTKVIKPFKGDKPKVHKLCANVQPKPCANFTLQAAPTPIPSTTPSPGESPSPTPTDTPQASGPRLGGGGVSGLDIITRPPFVFLPIIGIIGLLGVLAYWLLSSRRRPTPTSSPTVVHRATRPDYMAPFPTAGAAPVTPPPPAQPSAWDQRVQAPPIQAPPPPPAVQAPYTPYVPPPVPPQAPPPPVEAPPTPFTPPPAAPQAMPPPPTHREVEWPAPPNPPAVPDEPPDLPQPSD